MKIYVKILIALAAISAGVVSYAGALPEAEQDAGVSGDYSYWEDHDCGSWCRYHRQYDEKRMQVRFGVGISSFLVLDNFSAYSTSDNVLKEHYRDYRGGISSAGSYAIGFQYNLTKTFSVGVDASAEILWYDVYDSIRSKKVGDVTGAALTFLPQIRLNYFNRPNFRLYSAASIGFIAYCGDYSNTRGSYAEDYGSFDGSVEVAWQISLLGCEIGRTVFAFAEAGFGHLYSIGRVGIGYRF